MGALSLAGRGGTIECPLIYTYILYLDFKSTIQTKLFGRIWDFLDLDFAIFANFWPYMSIKLGMPTLVGGYTLIYILTL